MTPELQNALFAKYPKIFRQKDLPMSETNMCWGFECGDGWYTLLDNLCSVIQQHVDHTGIQQVEAAQVKEKFGSLCFYTDHADDFVQGAIDMAEAMSTRYCEVCGQPGKTYTKGWHVTLCVEHAQARNKIDDDEK